MITITFSDHVVVEVEDEAEAQNWLSHSQGVKKALITKNGYNWAVDRAFWTHKYMKPKPGALDPDAARRAAGWN